MSGEDVRGEAEKEPEPITESFLRHVVASTTSYSEGWREVCARLLWTEAGLTRLEQENERLTKERDEWKSAVQISATKAREATLTRQQEAQQALQKIADFTHPDTIPAGNWLMADEWRFIYQTAVAALTGSGTRTNDQPEPVVTSHQGGKI